MVRPVSRCSADHAVAVVPLPDWDGAHHAEGWRPVQEAVPLPGMACITPASDGQGSWLARNRRWVPGGLPCSRRRPQPGLGLSADASFFGPGARPTACLSIRSPIRWW